MTFHHQSHRYTSLRHLLSQQDRCQLRMLANDVLAWDHVWYYDRKWRDDGTLERIKTISIIFASAIDKQFIRVFQSRCGYHGAVEDELLPGWRLLCVQKD